MTEPRKITKPFADYQQVQDATPDPEAVARTAEELRAAQEKEYGKFVAAEQIFIGGALAYNPGHAVPISAVSDTGPVYPGQVALRPPPEKAEPAKGKAKPESSAG
jgi:hypothetical protein